MEKWGRRGNVYENKGSYALKAVMYMKTGGLVFLAATNQRSTYDIKSNLGPEPSPSHLGLHVLTPRRTPCVCRPPAGFESPNRVSRRRCWCHLEWGSTRAAGHSRERPGHSRESGNPVRRQRTSEGLPSGFPLSRE